MTRIATKIMYTGIAMMVFAICWQFWDALPAVIEAMKIAPPFILILLAGGFLALFGLVLGLFKR